MSQDNAMTQELLPAGLAISPAPGVLRLEISLATSACQRIVTEDTAKKASSTMATVQK